jgi:Zn-dependent protease
LDLDIAGRLLNLIVLVLSLTVHEFFHAWTAHRLGDDTAARMGRLTLNPLPHIDIFGTILLPLFNAPIGWAKPVPVNPAGFRQGVRMSTGEILVSVAGPLSNLGIALLAAVAFGLLVRLAPDLIPVGGAAEALLSRFILVNTGLAVFNLVPLPPLDGNHVLGNLLPYRYRDAWARFQRVGPFLLLGLILVESQTGLPLLTRVIGPPRGLLIGLFEQIIRILAG